MKKLKLAIVLLTFLTLNISCGVNPTKLISKTMAKVYIGMPLSEFKEKIKKIEIIEMTESSIVFKKTIRTYDGLFWNDLREDVRFFYFTDDKLVDVKEGIIGVDYRVRVDQR